MNERARESVVRGGRAGWGRRVGVACAVVVSVMGGAMGAPPDAVGVRGRGEVVRGAVEGIDVQGLRLRVPGPGQDEVTGAGSKVVAVSWDQVREVAGPRAAEAGRYGVMGEELWRARGRVERGDVGLAEAGLGGVYRAEGGVGRWAAVVKGRGPTAWVLHEVVLRARLSRGWQTGAVVPWLGWLSSERARRAESGVAWEMLAGRGGAGGAGGAGGMGTTGLMDGATGLCVMVPPVFSREVSPRGIGAMLSSEEWAVVGAAWAGDGAVTELAELYKLAAAGEQADLTAVDAAMVMPPAVSAEAAVLLVRDMVASRVGDAVTRAAAREALERRLVEVLARPARTGSGVESGVLGTWQEAWLRVAIGRSLLREADEGARRRGLVMLLHLPARLGEAHRYLTVVAVMESAAELGRMGDTVGAERLRGQARALVPVVEGEEEGKPGAAGKGETGKSGAGGAGNGVVR